MLSTTVLYGVVQYSHDRSRASLFTAQLSYLHVGQACNNDAFNIVIVIRDPPHLVPLFFLSLSLEYTPQSYFCPGSTRLILKDVSCSTKSHNYPSQGAITSTDRRTDSNNYYRVPGHGTPAVPSCSPRWTKMASS